MKKKLTMQLGMIGMHRMGTDTVRRLIKNGHRCVVFDQLPKAVKDLTKAKAVGASSLAELYTSDSVRAMTPTSKTSCCRQCATDSAAIWKNPQSKGDTMIEFDFYCFTKRIGLFGKFIRF